MKNWLIFLVFLSLAACETPASEASRTGKKIAPTSIVKANEKLLTVEGTVVETAPLEEAEGLWISLEDADQKGYFLNFYRDENPQVYDALPEDLTDRRLKVTYEEEVENVALDLIPLGMMAGHLGKNYGNLTVYTLKGKQVKVEEDNSEELLITVALGSGAERVFRAETSVYQGANPSDYDGKKVQIVYMETSELFVKHLEIN